MRFLSFPPSFALRRISAALALSALMASAIAVPVAEMHAEDYLPMAAELKKSLNLNANQQTLWSQTESRTRKLLADRKVRRDRLQAAALAGAKDANAELRELGKLMDEETTQGAAEEKQLREWWLTVNDALTEGQRQAVVRLVSEQLLRVQDNGGGNPRPERKEEGGEHRGGKGGRGGMGGGGMGVGVGAGGVNVNLPGGGG